MQTSVFLKKIADSMKRKARIHIYALLGGQSISHVEMSGSGDTDPFVHTVCGTLIRGGYVFTEGLPGAGRMIVDTTFCIPVNYSKGYRRLMYLSLGDYFKVRRNWSDHRADPCHESFFVPPLIWADNYYHFLVETLPAIHWALTNTDLKIVMPEMKPSYLRFFNHFGWDWHARVRVLGRSGTLRGTFIGLTNVRVIRKGSFTLPNPKLLDFYRGSVPPRKGGGGVLLISRKHTGDRRILNEDELLDRLSRHFDCEVLTPEKEDFASQLRKIHQASVIVGSHGAGLTNVLFHRGVRCMIEVSLGTVVNNSYSSLCEAIGIDHRFVISCRKDQKRMSGIDFLLPDNRKSYALSEAGISEVIGVARTYV